jgi:hypothetical protein
MNLTSKPEQVLASLEPDQLATAKLHFPRRVLKGLEILLLWSLRLYLLFMLAVVLYQIWTAGR